MIERARQLLLVPICLWTLSASTQAEQIEFSFTSSYDGSEQLAFALVPDSIGVDEKRPLLVLAHHA